VIAALLALALTAAPCHDHGVHFRAALKNRPAPATLPATIATLTVSDVLAWPVLPTAARRADVPVDPREASLFRLTGYVRLIKQSPDDCDIHVQVADSPSGDAPEVIVEASPNQPAARASLARIVGHAITGTPVRFDGPDAPRITVTGFAFVDLEHANALDRWTARGHGHGTAAVATLWELHPIIAVEDAR
jgi:hypothetical protein